MLPGLRPLNIYQTDKKTGEVVTDEHGKPVVLPEHQQRPKTEAELSAGDRAMLEHGQGYERDKMTRDAKAALAEEMPRLMAQILRERQQAGK